MRASGKLLRMSETFREDETTEVFKLKRQINETIHEMATD